MNLILKNITAFALSVSQFFSFYPKRNEALDFLFSVIGEALPVTVIKTPCKIDPKLFYLELTLEFLLNGFYRIGRKQKKNSSKI